MAEKQDSFPLVPVRPRKPRMPATLEDRIRVLDRPLRRGRYLSETDVDTRRRVAVLGSEVAAKLFGDVDPIGRQVTISGVRFRVIGLYEPVGATFGVARDQEVHIPVTTAQRPSFEPFAFHDWQRD